MQTQRLATGGSSTRRATRPRELQLEEGRSRRRASADDGGQGRAKGLGWFSIGLGLAQILLPGEVARLIGARNDERTRKTLQGIGFREVTSGIGILTQPRPAGWLWSRVAGDLMDLALLGKTLNAPHADRSRVAAATAAVVGVTVLDTMSAIQLGNGNGNGHSLTSNGSEGLLSRGKRAVQAALPHAGVQVKRAITINLPPHQVYAFWRDFQNLPRFMAHLESVEVLDGRSRWRAKAPAGMTVEWEAEVMEDRPNEMIAWRSLPGTLVPNQGSVRFMAAPGGRGTEVFVELRYEPPGGAVGAAIAKLFGEEPSQQVAGDLRRLKQVLETGEVMHSDASVHRGAHAAQPSLSAGTNGNGKAVTS